LADLVHCPFCDFAAILDDPEATIFECQNELCGVSSCRHCRVAHYPRTCDRIHLLKTNLTQEYRSENKISAKHTVEEAMTAALVRNCNACKKPFFKEEGCNQMTCPCGNKQCFVCSVDVRGYDHFDRTDDNSGPQDCPMFDNTVERLRQEVAAAQTHAVQEVMQERRDLTEADLTVDPNLDGGNRAVLRNEDNVLDRVRVRREQIARVRDERERQAEIAQWGAERYREQRQERIRERRCRERERQEELQREAEEREQERLECERDERERLEVERMERQLLEAQHREEQEALEVVRNFEMQQRLEEERLIQQAICDTAEEERWNAYILKRTAYVSETEIQNLPAYEIEMYWAGRYQHLLSCITDLKAILTDCEHRRSQGTMSKNTTRRYDVGKTFLEESLQDLDRFTREAKVRKKHYEMAEKKRRKEAAESLKQRVKEREQERKGMEVVGRKLRKKNKLFFWKKS
jgi:hypothetical protein